MLRRRSPLSRGASAARARPGDTLVDRALDAICRVRLAPRPRLEYINRAILAFTGYSQQEWYDDPGVGLRLLHPADRRKLLEIARTGRLPSQPMLLRWVRRDGSALRTEIAAVAVRNKQGTTIAIEAVARDVTSAQRDADAAKTADRFQRLALDRLPTGVAHLAADGRFLHVNRRLCDITGFSPEEMCARRLQDVAHPDQQEDGRLLQQVLTTGLSEATVEKPWVCKDRSLTWVRITATRLGDGAAAGVIATVQRVAAPAGREDEQRRLSYAGIAVDIDRLEVVWNEQQVPLTLKEVLLLRYLIRHSGEMLARDRLLHDVWGYEHAGRSRTLDVHICRLRRKLPPLTDSLVTIGHYGYTLSQPTATAQATVST